MAFCCKDIQLATDKITGVDNKFIINYMPDAPDMRSAVYLLGLALSDSVATDNSVESMAKRLNITEQEVFDAFAYWEEMGLVNVVNSTPVQVVYLPLRNDSTILKKVKPSKYTKFSREIQSVISGRMITVNEYNEYFMFLETTTFEPEALIAVAKYSTELKGNNINYPYILTVSRNLLAKGATTLAAVSESLNSQQKYDDDLHVVFKALTINRKIDHEDRELYEKWTKKMGFTLDVIKSIATRCRNGGMKKLDTLVMEYYRKGILDAKEIDAYENYKTSLYDLARDINKNIGVYYQSLDIVVDEYITEWLRKGYDSPTLLAISKYCFRSGIRTLNGLASVIDNLYKAGVVSSESLEQYIAVLAAKDNEIKNVLEKAGLVRNVTTNDRQLYRIWTEIWQMPSDLINWTAERSIGTINPIAYINRILSDLKQRGIKTVSDAEKDNGSTATVSNTTTTRRADIGGIRIDKHQYTDAQLNALFSTLDESEDN